MTTRLYYTDSYLQAFSATVTHSADEGRRVYLSQTAFYPTSGGQPHDLGTLGGAQVIDVVDEDDRIAHVLSEPLASDVIEVSGNIDWERRYDLMQQHTGQHLLSAMFEDRYGWPTVSVHFGAESSTLDITTSEWDASVLEEAERHANLLVAANSEVLVSFEDGAVVQGLRKASDWTGLLRVITITDLDRSACGGTHVRCTGEIGGILLRRVERTKGHTRIEFVCGLRAVRTARRDAALLARTASLFTAASEDVPRLVEVQQQQLRDFEREHRKLKAEMASFEAQRLWQGAIPDEQGIRRIAVALAQGAVKEQEPLAQALAALGGVTVVISSVAPLGVMLATSADSNVDAGKSLRAVITPLGGRGGGSPRVAQGTVPDATSLAAAVEALSRVHN